MSDFHGFVQSTKSDFEEILKNKIYERRDGERLWEIMTGGKRFRPILCVLSYKVCNGAGSNSKSIWDTSVAVELGHSASICHDDIIDENYTRRKNSASWVKNGIPETLMIGHRMISLGFKIALSQGEKIAKTFLNAWDTSSEGELEEINVRYNRMEISPAIYNSIISKKTASLFSAAAKSGSQIAEASQDLQKLMERYGLLVGRAYQLADDLSEIPEKENFELFELLEETEGQDWNSVDNFLRKNIEDNLKKAKKISENNEIPDNDFKSFLRKLPEYFINQILEEG